MPKAVQSAFYASSLSRKATAFVGLTVYAVQRQRRKGSCLPSSTATADADGAPARLPLACQEVGRPCCLFVDRAGAWQSNLDGVRDDFDCDRRVGDGFAVGPHVEGGV